MKKSFSTFLMNGTGSVWCSAAWYLMVRGQYGAVLLSTWWHWVSKRQYWLIHDGTGSDWGDTCWYLVVLDQYRAVMVDTWWNWVSIGPY